MLGLRIPPRKKNCDDADDRNGVHGVLNRGGFTANSDIKEQGTILEPMENHR